MQIDIWKLVLFEESYQLIHIVYIDDLPCVPYFKSSYLYTKEQSYSYNDTNCQAGAKHTENDGIDSKVDVGYIPDSVVDIIVLKEEEMHQSMTGNKTVIQEYVEPKNKPNPMIQLFLIPDQLNAENVLVNGS